VISHEWGKDREVFTTSGTYYVIYDTYILVSNQVIVTIVTLSKWWLQVSQESFDIRILITHLVFSNSSGLVAIILYVLLQSTVSDCLFSNFKLFLQYYRWLFSVCVLIWSAIITKYILKSDSTHHFFRNTCIKSGSLRFSQFSGCWLIFSVYILLTFPL
jgi:hypothetical protein